MIVKINNLKQPFSIRIDEDGNGMASLYGKVISFNIIAIEFIQLLNNGNSVSKNIELLLEDYEVDYNVLEKDLYSFTNKLCSYDIVDRKVLEEFTCHV